MLAAIGTMVAVFIYANTEGAMSFASGLTEAAQWFAIFDVATYMDVIGLLVLLAASIRFRAALRRNTRWNAFQASYRGRTRQGDAWTAPLA